MEGPHLLQRRIFCSSATPTAASVSKLTSLLAAGRFYASVKVAASILHSSRYRRPVSRIVDLFHEIAAAAPSTQPHYLRDAASTLIVASARLRLPDGALRLLSVLAADVHLPMPSVSSCGVLMDGLFRLGRYGDVLQTYDIFCGARVHVDESVLFIKVLRACIAAGDLDEAVDKLKQAYEPDNACYNLVLRALWSAGRDKEAHTLFYTIPVKHLSAITYNIMINGCCKWKDMGSAILHRCNMVVLGFLPDTVTYNTLIFGFLRCRMMQEIGALLGEMVTRNMTLDRFSRSMIFELLAKMQDSEDLLSLLHKSFDKGVLIENHTCGVIVNCLCSAGRVVEADEVFRKLLKAGMRPTKMIYNKLVDGYFLVGNVPAAADLFLEMSNSIGLDSITWNTYVKGLCSQGMMNEAWNMVCKMGKDNISIEAFNTIIDSFGKVGMLDDCVIAFKGIKEKGLKPNAISYGALMNVLCKVGRLSEALCLLKEVIISDTKMDSQVFHILIDASIESGDTTGASKLRKVMQSYGILEDIVTVNLDIKLKCREGNIAAAESVVLKLIEEPIAPLRPDVITYITIISACCKAQRIDRAVMFYQLMLKQAIRPPKAVYKLLLSSLKALGRSIDVQKVHDEMVHENIIRTQRGKWAGERVRQRSGDHEGLLSKQKKPKIQAPTLEDGEDDNGL